jgi:hypothetical protein
VTFISGAMMFIKGTITFVEGAMMFVKGAMIFIDRAVMFIGGAIIFIGKGSLAVKRLFKMVKAKIADNKVNRCNLKQ